MSSHSCRYFVVSCSLGLKAMLLAMKRCTASSSSQDGLFPALTFAQYKKAICEDWFQSPSTLALRALGPRLIISDSTFPEWHSPSSGCANEWCSGPLSSTQNMFGKQEASSYLGRGMEFQGWCSSPVEVLAQLLPPTPLPCWSPFQSSCFAQWLAFIYFVNAMRLNYRWAKLMVDMDSLFGVKNKRTFQTWRSSRQDALKLCLHKHGSLVIGKSPGDVVLFDETHAHG